MDPLPHSVVSKLIRELREIQQNTIDGVKVFISEENICDVQAEYEGPAETPYEGGIFKMRLVFGSDFPRAPPKGYFLTKIFHPNVSSSGEICVNVLKRDWNPELGLRHVLTVIRCLLIEPNAESALNEEAGKLLLESFDEFAAKARLMTDIHAKKQIQILTATGGANALNAEGAGDSRAIMKSKTTNSKQRPAGVDKKRSLRRL